ncbi:MAG: hypothetical protein KatS3mg061_1941 [Dehalococcoidia bacterium]|nr:MAG: hypothetical protein KatS3mg061_1941 [Dehalococcoidia bacterium]
MRWTETFPRTGLRARRLWFTLHARDPVDLGSSPGAALRGALLEALAERGHPPASCPATCPLCLLTASDPAWLRGRELPRPVTIEAASRGARPGESWQFGLTLLGPAREEHAGFCAGVARAAERGIGRGRGRSTLVAVGDGPPFGEGDIDDQAVAAAVWPSSQLTLLFHSPLRLTAGRQLVHQVDLAVLVQRLIERIAALSLRYGRPELGWEEWQVLSRSLAGQAATIRLVGENTRWQEAFSTSRRSGRRTPLGGIVGWARWEGAVEPLLPWLRWGEVLHVGKGAVKGNGWFGLVLGDSG